MIYNSIKKIPLIILVIALLPTFAGFAHKNKNPQKEYDAAIEQIQKTKEEKMKTNLAVQNLTEAELLFDNKKISIPCPLKSFLDDGWNMSDSLRYFNRFYDKDYYDMRYELQAERAKTKSIPNDYDLRLVLEKDGSYIEVIIFNKSGVAQPVEDCTIFGINVNTQYTKNQVVLKNGISFGMPMVDQYSFENVFQKTYTGQEGWIHAPSDYFAELGFFDYYVTNLKQPQGTLKELHFIFAKEEDHSLFGIELYLPANAGSAKISKGNP